MTLRKKIEEIVESLLDTENGELLELLKDGGYFKEATDAILQAVREIVPEKKGKSTYGGLACDREYVNWEQMSGQGIAYNQAIDHMLNKIGEVPDMDGDGRLETEYDNLKDNLNDNENRGLN